MTEPLYQSERVTLHCGDVLDVLRQMPEESVHCVVTSPPYWGLRDYGTAEWDGGDERCDHKLESVVGRGDDFRERGESHGYDPGSNFANYGDRNATASDFKHTCPKCGARRIDSQLGLEATPDLYVAKMVEVFREVRRVLRSDGCCWANWGDSYNGQGARSPNIQANGDLSYRGGGRSIDVPNLKPKDLVGMPWRMAFALRDDGWWLRSDIIWSKLNPMPESCTDRPTKSHEYVFLLTKRATYFYDSEAIREGVTGGAKPQGSGYGRKAVAFGQGIKNNHSFASAIHNETREDMPTSRNRRTVWQIPTESFPEAHFATFPRKLVQPCIAAGTSDRGCCPAMLKKLRLRSDLTEEQRQRVEPFLRKKGVT